MKILRIKTGQIVCKSCKEISCKYLESVMNPDVSRRCFWTLERPAYLDLIWTRLITARKLSLGQGNVFTGVCLSTMGAVCIGRRSAWGVGVCMCVCGGGQDLHLGGSASGVCQGGCIQRGEGSVSRASTFLGMPRKAVLDPRRSACRGLCIFSKGSTSRLVCIQGVCIQGEGSVSRSSWASPPHNPHTSVLETVQIE